MLNPTVIYADFEEAAQRAARHHFPSCIIKGCWFHFRKAIMKKAFSIGIKPLYIYDEYKNFLAQLGALALIPLDKIDAAILIIRDNLPQQNNKDCPLCLQLLEYFMVQWIQSKST